MALAPGFEQQPDGALEAESYLTGRFPHMFVVDEHPVRCLLLAKHNDLNLASITQLRPGRQRRGHDHLNNSDMALLHEEIDNWGIVRSKTQAIDDHFVIDLAGNEDIAVQREQQTQLAQLAQRN
jgi:hypothetical protein